MHFCRDHELHFQGHERCPHCLRGIYPSRDLRAIRDFVREPLPGTVDVPTWQTPIRLSEVARRLGRELAEIEADRMSRCADLDLRAKEVRKQMQRMRIRPRDMHRAVRVAIGYKEERPLLSAEARAYLSVIEDDGINW